MVPGGGDISNQDMDLSWYVSGDEQGMDFDELFNTLAQFNNCLENHVP